MNIKYYHKGTEGWQPYRSSGPNRHKKKPFCSPMRRHRLGMWVTQLPVEWVPGTLSRWGRPPTSTAVFSHHRSTFVPRRNPGNNFLYTEEYPSTRTFIYQKTKKRVGSAKNYYSIANYQTKIPAIFLEIFGNCRGVSKFVHLYSTIPRVTLDGKWETLTY
jgi:hypothetical protein